MSLFSCSLSGDLSVTFKRAITVRATLTGHFDDVIAFVNLCVMLLVCLQYNTINVLVPSLQNMADCALQCQ